MPPTKKPTDTDATNDVDRIVDADTNISQVFDLDEYLDLSPAARKTVRYTLDKYFDPKGATVNYKGEDFVLRPGLPMSQLMLNESGLQVTDMLVRTQRKQFADLLSDDNRFLITQRKNDPVSTLWNDMGEILQLLAMSLNADPKG
jgi:hypothetical protein